MKKTVIAGLIALASVANAHEVWVSAPTKLTSGSVLKAELAYGDYPYVEKIPEARLSILRQWKSLIMRVSNKHWCKKVRIININLKNR